MSGKAAVRVRLVDKVVVSMLLALHWDTPVAGVLAKECDVCKRKRVFCDEVLRWHVFTHASLGMFLIQHHDAIACFAFAEK